MEPVIETRGLTKVFKSFWGRSEQKALDHLSIRIEPGEVYGLIGPNGCGKTTTFKLLLGLIFPTAGTATVLGRLPTDVSSKDRLGFVPEESYFYRWLNADETLDLFGRLSGLDHVTRRRRIDELIERFDLGRARHRKLREYSKGMVRRVGFCQALINDPDLLILDEPTSGLDPISSHQIKDLILDLKERGKTVLLSSHLLTDVQLLCDRITILHQGQTKLQGSVHDLLVRKDTIKFTFAGLSDSCRKKIEEVAKGEGAHVVRAEMTQETLEQVFLRTIRESGGLPASPPLPKSAGGAPGEGGARGSGSPSN